MVDWEVIESKYRIGIQSVRQIAEQHGITHAAIIKRANRDDWPRDLNAKMQTKAEELFIRKHKTREQKVTKTCIQPSSLVTIEVTGASMKADIMGSHAGSLDRMRRLGAILMDELEAQVLSRAPLAEMLKMADIESAAKDAAFKILSTPGLIRQYKELADVEVSCRMAMERKLFKLEEFKPVGEDGARRSIPIEFVQSTWRSEDEEPALIRIPGS